ncbi:hypothetical protein QR77_15225 [Streptomyces sp. 150FB]|nr:hypothetical protein [Streptomyces sp. 150FB]KIF74942.1 hypothetical protein QR77_15225 [Streptomyces sp. 150FB]
MASPGYGKRSTSSQPAPAAADFSLLPAREAAVAGYIDRLPDGADISVKALAKVLPYGQCAMRTALRLIQRAGFLRRGREHLVTEHAARWVTHTWFSRTAMSEASWAAYLTGDDQGVRAPSAASGEPVAVDEPGPEPESEPEPESDPREVETVGSRLPARLPERSPAYAALAALGHRKPDLSLSAAECAALEPLAAAWFERGATEEMVLRALTDRLPVAVQHPAGFIRQRLTAKLPPAYVPPAARPPMRLMECSTCGAPGRPETLQDGDCGTCRGERARPEASAASSPYLPPETVRARVAEARAAARPTLTAK